MIRLDTVLFKGEKIKDWNDYFDYNRTHLLKLDYENNMSLTKKERNLTLKID